ncbi:hypothetical protein EfsSVR2332_34480 [Enterococcus faecalis]|uniref:Uncharacterized protein n=1 Tax=Enterococcus faecalis TaxID=1351 RepID=A0AC59HUQ2_ENTFL|nr:hypothetical protein EfsSVR2332_34480 [Enterococcus faecalis]
MRDQTSGKMIRFYYTSLQFLYWMMFCSVYGFATLFLIYFKIDPAKIGGDLSIGQYCFNGASAFYQSSDHQEKKDPTDHRAEDDDSRIRSDSLSWGIDSEFADHYLYLGWDFSSFYAIISQCAGI